MMDIHEMGDEAMKIPNHEISAEANRLAVLATIAIERAMERRSLRRCDIASRLNIPASRVTKVLDEEANITLKTLAQFGLACGVRWQFEGTDVLDGSVAVSWSAPKTQVTYDLDELLKELQEFAAPEKPAEVAPSTEGFRIAA